MGEVVLLGRHYLKCPDRSIMGIIVLPQISKTRPRNVIKFVSYSIFFYFNIRVKKINNIYNVLWGEPPLELPILRCFTEITVELTVGTDADKEPL